MQQSYEHENIAITAMVQCLVTCSTWSSAPLLSFFSTSGVSPWFARALDHLGILKAAGCLLMDWYEEPDRGARYIVVHNKVNLAPRNSAIFYPQL
jgi:hypothetical protein